MPIGVNISEAEKVAIVDELASGLTHKAVGKLHGVTRGAISRLYRKLLTDGAGIPTRTSKAQRCPTCFGMVFMPCRLCTVRAEKGKD